MSVPDGGPAPPYGAASLEPIQLQLVHALPLPVLVIGMDDTVLAASRAGAELFGLPEAAVARRLTFEELAVSYRVEGVRSLLEAVKRDGDARTLASVRWDGDALVDMHARPVVDRDRRPVAIVMAAVPLGPLAGVRVELDSLRQRYDELLAQRATEREELSAVNEELRLANETLQEQVQKLQAAELADARKNQFLAMLAHELRNPLGTVSSALRVIGEARTPPAQVSRALRIAERQVRHEARLLDDLLDVSRIVLGKVTLQTTSVDLCGCLRDVVESVRLAADAQAIDLRMQLPDEPLTVRADRTRLEQCAANLLNNAVKFTAAGGRVTLTAHRDGEHAVVTVGDTGVGIAPDMLERVFDLFSQVDGTLARGRGGLGIGLTLVQALVRLHGGTVAARSEGVGRGSEFEMRLPLAPAAPPPAESPPAPAPSRRRILLVDDNADAREMLRALLQLDGHTVLEAADGITAVRRALESVPDVIILDVGLPGLDGFEVARRVRKRLGNLVRLVAVSGYGDPDSRQRGRQAGFDAHLVKPVSPEDLARVLNA